MGLSRRTSPKTCRCEQECEQVLRGGADTEPQRLHGAPSTVVRKRRVEALRELWTEQLQLLRPDRRAARDGHDAVALGDRPALGADPFSDHLVPARLDARERRRRGQGRGDAGEGLRQRTRRQAPPAAAAAASTTVPSRTAVTFTSASVAPGT